MDRRSRQKVAFSGFAKPEIEKMEKLFRQSEEEVSTKEFSQKIARSFNSSAGRAGKPAVKWTEVQSWFVNKQQDSSSRVRLPDKENGHSPSDKELEFEARSSKDGAWYDVEVFVAHRITSAGEVEELCRYIGFGPEEDEWVNVTKDLRTRSIPLENSECNKVKVGDLVLCYQERRDEATHYDAHVIKVERKMHDIRGCRCLFQIRYVHDNTQEEVRLKRLCRRP